MTNKQYPPQSGKYAVKVKNGRGWAAFSIARLQISVGQEYHENEKFKATIQWAMHRFTKVIICVNDTLQRHNYIYKENLDEAVAYQKSEDEGKEWLERNQSIISILPNYQIHRWEDWRKQPDFFREHKRVMDLYDSEPFMKELILNEVCLFWERLKKKENVAQYSFSSFKEASVNYLLEETAAFFLMFKRDEAVDIYPGSVLLPCVLARKYCDAASIPLLGERAFTRIDFHRSI